MNSNDTIAAISTAFGNAGIAIVRISGNKSLAILKKVFKSQNQRIKKLESHKLYYGQIAGKKGKTIDEVLVCYFKKPKSYTKEDMIEIHCHGGFITANKILERILEEGARIARPGEFTERAFLSGRLDLTQAEAVADIIYAKSEKAQELAEEQLRGSLKTKIKSILTSILKTYSHILANIDFPDEDIPEIKRKDIAKKISKPIEEMEEILTGVSLGTIYKEGFKVAIVGLPNAGKSSLLNSLVKDARAIVTDIPGTTRDIIEEQIEIDGVLIRLFDTAGITKAEDKVEKEGVLRSFKAIKNANLLLIVLEKLNDLEKFLELTRTGVKNALKTKKVILARSKSDLRITQGELVKPEYLEVVNFVESSAKNGKGIKKIEKTILGQVQKEDTRNSILLANLRQEHLLGKALNGLRKAKELSQKEETEDKILLELDSVISNLKEIIGEAVTDNILEKVFSRFCVGK